MDTVVYNAKLLKCFNYFIYKMKNHETIYIFSTNIFETYIYFVKVKPQQLCFLIPWWKVSMFVMGVEHMFTLCLLRECRACLMISYSSACSPSVMARQDESLFNLSSFVAAQGKELQSKGEDGACLAWGLCWSSGPEREFGLGLGVWDLQLRNLERIG